MAVKVSSLNARRALEALGANIKTARLKRRISVKGFAERVGVSESTIMRLEKGDDGVSIGTLTKSLQGRVREAVPRATLFVSGLEWLHGPDTAEDETAIGRLLLVDRSTILVSSIVPDTGDEQAIFGEGFGNGLVVIAWRLMAQGLIPARDPST